MLLSAEHLYKDYGTKPLLTDATLYLNERERMGVIGVNGTGKSTLLRILAGAEQPDAGSVSFQRNARVAYLAQNPPMDEAFTVLEQVFSTFDPAFRQINQYEAVAMLNRLGIPDPEARIGTLSGGQRKRVALAATLIHPADILILDEPTNHLDSDMVLWLESRLARFAGGLVMVTHDRYFLERVCNRMVELDRGRLTAYEANYSAYLEQRALREDMAQAGERKRQSILRREAEWIHRGARARSTKSRERIERYNALLAQDAPTVTDKLQMTAPGARLGKKLIELEAVTKAFDGRTVLAPFTYHLQRTDRIGIVGRNGAGKSTLLNLIAGVFPPDSGVIEVGATVRIGYFTQEGRELDSRQRVYDFITDIADKVETDEGTFTASQLLERFLFPGELQFSPIGKLSGGERRRLYLLSILMAAPNILLLDEPTNDLDIETLTILEEYLDSFPGAVIAVSHDRYFLDKIATSIFAVEENGEISRYVGGFSEYLEKRPAPEAAPDTAPKPAPAPRAATPRKRKLSFKEQRELETIDAELADLEARAAACEQAVNNAGSDYEKLMAATADLDAARAALDAKTDRWLELQALLEEIAAQ